jgi:hypothetical protein
MDRIWQSGGTSVSGSPSIGLLRQDLAAVLELSKELQGMRPPKRGPAPKLQQQMERIQRLPRTLQRFLMEVIDTVLARQDR